MKVNSHRFELYRAYSIFGQFVKSCQIFLKYQSSGKENESTSSTKLSRCSRAVAAMNVQKSVVHKQSFCFASLLIFAVLVAVVVVVAQASDSLLFTSILAFNLNCANASENTKHCKFKPIQLLMEPSPTTCLPKKPHQSGFETIFSS